MKNKELKIKSIPLLLTAFLLVSLAGCADKKNEEKLQEMQETIDTLNADKKLLQELNRSSI